MTMYAFPDEVEIQQKEEAVVPVCWEDDGGPTQTELLGIKIAVGHHERLRSLDMVQSWGAKVGGTACDRGSDGMCQRSTGAR